MTEPNEPAAPYYPALDGLRGIAVVMVMLTHTLYRPFAFGWMGVPLFFALSGFLITGILLRTKANPGYFARFYRRRAVRIFPIYYLFIAFSLIVGAWLGMHVKDLWRAAIYIQNYRDWRHPQQIPGFFGGHTWSLAVEEQFYLLWPLLVWLVPIRALTWCCVTIVVGALGFRWFGFVASNDPGKWLLYGWLPANLDCLACGALVAILHHERRLRAGPMLVAIVVGGAGLAMLILHTSWDAWQSSDLWLNVRVNVLLNTTLGITCAGLVGYFALRPAWPLTGNVLRYLGRISYGLYLYHVPVYFWVDRWFRTTVPHWYRTPIKLVATFVIASLSWWLLERRLLAGSRSRRSER